MNIFMGSSLFPFLFVVSEVSSRVREQWRGTFFVRRVLVVVFYQ